MFSTKNITPRQLAAITAIVLAVPVSVLVYFVEDNWVWAAASLIILFLGAYILISFMLERFIYRKIKLIYKFIYQTKASRKEETYYKYVLPQKSIDEVREDVEAWAEENKKEIELLKKNEQFRREFLQNLSHEFKTPVFAIQGYVESLLTGAMKNPDINKNFLEKAAKNVDRLSNLLNDLDEISSLERGELVLYKQNFVIQELIKDVYESLSIKADQKNIRCIIKKDVKHHLPFLLMKKK